MSKIHETRAALERGVAVSVVLHSRNPGAWLADTVRRTIATLEALAPSFEVIVCDDASTDASEEILSRLSATEPRLIVRHRNHPGGRHLALREGLSLVRGTVVVTMEADGRISPEQIPALLLGIKTGHDIVSGRRVRRQVALLTRLRSLGARMVLSFASGLPGRDWGCSFRAYRRHAVSALLRCPELTFMLPDLLDLQGFKSARVPVSERPVQGSWRYGHRFRSALLSIALLRTIARLRVSGSRVKGLSAGGPGES
ncbi:MAG: glycosyltransferase family 2 protein [Planctomycetota bacterium]